MLLPLSFNLSSDAYAIISPVDETCAKVTLLFVLVPWFMSRACELDTENVVPDKVSPLPAL